MRGPDRRTRFSWNLVSSLKRDGFSTPARRLSGTASKSRMASHSRRLPFIARASHQITLRLDTARRRVFGWIVAAGQRAMPASLEYVTTNVRRTGEKFEGGTEAQVGLPRQTERAIVEKTFFQRLQVQDVKILGSVAGGRSTRGTKAEEAV